VGDAPQDQIVCATYTHARRHPMVLGHIAGWTPPFQVSLPQLGVLALVLWIEMQTWRWWGALLPRSLAIVIAIVVPCALAWAVRRARIEGRSLVRAAVGGLMLLSTPPGGRVGGRPHHPARAVDMGRARVYIAAGDDGR
jgi:hypothetical protein